MAFKNKFQIPKPEKEKVFPTATPRHVFGPKTRKNQDDCLVEDCVVEDCEDFCVMLMDRRSFFIVRLG